MLAAMSHVSYILMPALQDAGHWDAQIARATLRVSVHGRENGSFDADHKCRAVRQDGAYAFMLYRRFDMSAWC